MNVEFRRALLGLFIAQSILFLGALRFLADPAAREIAFRAQFLSTGNLVALFALSKILVEFAADSGISARRRKIPALIFWGGLKLALLVGLILYLALQKQLLPSAVLWGIAPWVAGPLGVAMIRALDRLRGGRAQSG